MPSLNPDSAGATATSTAGATATATAYPKRDLASLLALARPFLRDEPDAVPSDPALSPLLSALRAAGAGECWHKHGTFLAHLTGVHRILTLWSAPLPVARCGLYHSAYSNSYVNLAIFEPGKTSREALSLSLGPSAERLVHLFCIVPRQQIIHDFLLFRYSDDAELTDHLIASADSARGGIDEPWRRKINALVPQQGIYVKHIRTGEEVLVSRRVIAVFLLMTMADFSDQAFGFQDRLFNNEDGRLEFAGNNVSGALWPGDARPGLWMNYVSRMGAIYNLLVREEEICVEEKRREGRRVAGEEEEDEEIDLVIPPVFESCTRVLDAEDQKTARDLYWEAVAGDGGEKTEKLLRRSCEKNPFIGEPHVVLAQIYLGMERWEEAEREAEIGLRLMLEWGSGWDKRVTWEGWIAWVRVLLLKAKEKDWPKNAWGIINLGLVR